MDWCLVGLHCSGQKYFAIVDFQICSLKTYWRYRYALTGLKAIKIIFEFFLLNYGVKSEFLFAVTICSMLVDHYCFGLLVELIVIVNIIWQLQLPSLNFFFVKECEDNVLVINLLHLSFSFFVFEHRWLLLIKSFNSLMLSTLINLFCIVLLQNYQWLERH